MSGGSHNYICYAIENELCGQMDDDELNDLIKDVAKLAHDLEWAASADISYEDYERTVAKFKRKWFETSRSDRLKDYIDAELDRMKKRLYTLIGIEETEAEDDRHERSALNLLRAFKAMANAMNVDAGITINPGSTATDADLEDAIDFFLPRKDHTDKDTNVPAKNKTCE